MAGNRLIAGLVLCTIINSTNTKPLISIDNYIEENTDVEYTVINDECYKWEKGVGYVDCEILCDIQDEYEEISVQLVKDEDKQLLKEVVLGEARGEGFLGMCLVLQTIKDTMIDERIHLDELIKEHAYTGLCKEEQSEEINKCYEEAYKEIFENGKYVVKHKLKYFYAYKSVESDFHESLNTIVVYKNHKFM